MYVLCEYVQFEYSSRRWTIDAWIIQFNQPGIHGYSAITSAAGYVVSSMLVNCTPVPRLYCNNITCMVVFSHVFMYSMIGNQCDCKIITVHCMHVGLYAKHLWDLLIHIQIPWRMQHVCMVGPLAPSILSDVLFYSAWRMHQSPRAGWIVHVPTWWNVFCPCLHVTKAQKIPRFDQSHTRGVYISAQSIYSLLYKLSVHTWIGPNTFFDPIHKEFRFLSSIRAC